MTLKQSAKFQANFTMDECKFHLRYYSKTGSQQSSRQISQWMNVTMDDCNFHFRYHSKNSQQSSRQLSQWMNVTMDECNFPFGPTLFLRKFPSVSQPVSPFFLGTFVEHFTSYLRLLLSWKVWVAGSSPHAHRFRRIITGHLVYRRVKNSKILLQIILKLIRVSPVASGSICIILKHKHTRSDLFLYISTPDWTKLIK
jgi:hypothetical protein